MENRKDRKDSGSPGFDQSWEKKLQNDSKSVEEIKIFQELNRNKFDSTIQSGALQTEKIYETKERQTSIDETIGSN